MAVKYHSKQMTNLGIVGIGGGEESIFVNSLNAFDYPSEIR